MTADFGAQLDELLGTSIADFDIPDDVYQLAVARYEAVGTALAGYWEDDASDGDVEPQGSFRLGTVVQPINPQDDYDIDLVSRRNITKESTTRADLKADVGRGLGLYVVSAPEGSPTLNEGKRCWTLDYPAEPFHLDVLPAIPNIDNTPNGILITDKNMGRWQPSNPIDYASWFHGRMRQEFVQLREAIAKSMNIADVPEWRVKTRLQRGVQALKRHRDMYFADAPKDRPASIIITTLAAKAYAGGENLYEILVDVTAKMPTLVETRDGVYWVENPVLPEENFADRWREHPGRDEQFFTWIQQAQRDFAGYGEDRGVDTVLGKIAKSFGAAPARRAEEVFGSGLTRRRDAGLLGVGVGTGLLTTPSRRPAIPKHTFHGDA